MCQQLTQGLSALTEASPAAATHDPFSAAPLGQAASSNTPQSTAVPSHHPTPVQGTTSAGLLHMDFIRTSIFFSRKVSLLRIYYYHHEANLGKSSPF